MITIALRSHLGMTYAVDPHPAFYDLPGRETEEHRNDTEVDLHEDVAIAPLVASLSGTPAQDSLPDLIRVLEQIRKHRPDRTEGIALTTLLLSWARRWPGAYWDVSGNALKLLAAKGKGGIDYEGEGRPRYSDRSVTTPDPNAEPLLTGEIEQPNQACQDPNEVTQRFLTHTVDEAGQFQPMKTTGGGGSGGRVREKPRRRPTPNVLAGDGLSRSDFVGVRVSRETKELFEKREDGTRIAGAAPGEILERVGAAHRAGASPEEIEQALDEVIKRHRNGSTSASYPSDAA